ncbi:hypothetical protein IV87_GL001855 [Pediococcus ethanolidurans]|nr:hypothetical protein IV87_GL001855 [Pediococcus ethanolidurans]
MPTLADQIQDVPAIVGDVLEGVNIQSKAINIGVRIVDATSLQDLEERKHAIANWLMPSGNNEDPLTLDILPRWEFYAHVNAAFDATDSLYNSSFTIPFSCTDPHAYSQQKRYAINGYNLAIGVGDPVSVTNGKLYDVQDELKVKHLEPLQLDFDYTATASFSIVVAETDQDGTKHSQTLATINAGSGNYNGSIAAITQMGDMDGIELDVSSTAAVTISNFKIYYADQNATGHLVDESFEKVDDDLVIINDDTTITIHDDKSNATSYPLFTLIAPTQLTKIAIADNSGNDNYVFLGSETDPDVEAQITDNMPRVLWDRCNTMATWKNFDSTNKPTFDIENGVIGTGAAIDSTANFIRPKLDSKDHYMFGTSFVKGKWNGAGGSHPALSEPLSEWKFTVRAEIYCRDPRAMGKFELYMLDQNQARMGKVMLKDNANSRDVVLEVELGTHATRTHLSTHGTKYKGKTTKKSIKVYKGGKKTTKTVTYTVKGKKKKKTEVRYVTKKLTTSTAHSTFTNWYGNITFSFIGNKMSVSAMKLNSKQANAWAKPITLTKTLSDSDVAKYVGGHQLDAFAVYMAKYPITEDLSNPVKRYQNDYMRLDDLKVWKVINGGTSEVSSPMPICDPGDEIKIATEDGTVYRNGEPYNSLNGHQIKAIGSNITGLALEDNGAKTYSFYPSTALGCWQIDQRHVMD